MKEEDCRLCQYYSTPRCTHADFSIAGLMGARPRPPASHPIHPPPLPHDLWMTNDLLLSAYFFKLGTKLFDSSRVGLVGGFIVYRNTVFFSPPPVCFDGL